MAIAVIICTRDRLALLGPAVAAAALSCRQDDELVVVDSASRDRATVAAIALRAGARIVRCDRAGASRARNAGAAATSAPLLAFTDDDCRPERGWLESLERAFADPRTGFVTGRVLPDRETGRSLSVVVGEQARVFDAGDDPADPGSGANMGFRREAFDAVGGFDEDFGPGARFYAAEDHDLFWRVLHAGWRGRYEPDAIVVHEQWRGLRAYVIAHARYGVGSGALARKIASVDANAGRQLLRAGLLQRGVGRALTHARARYEVGAVAATVGAVGVAVGAARAVGHRWAPVASPHGVEGTGELGGHIGA